MALIGDYNAGLGGPIVRDKLWFFTALRQRANERSLGGFALNAGPDGQYLTGDEPPARPPDYLAGKLYPPLGLLAGATANPMQLTVGDLDGDRHPDVVGTWW